MAEYKNRTYYLVRRKKTGELHVAWYERGAFWHGYVMNNTVPFDDESIDVIRSLNLEALADG